MARFYGCHCKENGNMHGCMYIPRAVGESSHLFHKHKVRKNKYAGDEVSF